VVKNIPKLALAILYSTGYNQMKIVIIIDFGATGDAARNWCRRPAFTMTKPFVFTLKSIRFDETITPSKTRITTNFANLARGESRQQTCVRR
jgi:hypothetical protein